MRGDHVLYGLTVFGTLESPPHARGPLAMTLHLCQLLGITPACAGTTYSIFALEVLE